jgi:hypothetical protein
VGHRARKAAMAHETATAGALMPMIGARAEFTTPRL